MDYKDITNRMKVGVIYPTDYLVTSIANQLGIPQEDVQAALDSASSKFIERGADEKGNDTCKLLMHPMPNDSRD